MSAYKLSVNVVVRHQSRRAEEITQALGWQPHNAWSVGDRRVTPAGTALPGTRKETMCTFRFESNEDEGSPALAAVIEHLMSKESLVRELVISGGAIALNTGLNGQFNASFQVTPEALQFIGALGVSLSVECFPDG